MSLKALIAAGAAGGAAWVLFKSAKVGTGKEPKVIYVSQPAPSTEGNKLSGILGLVSGILDMSEGSNGEPIFNLSGNTSSTGLSDRLSGIASGLGDKLQTIGGNMMATTTGARLKSDLMRDFGLASHQAAGVVGNLDHETGGFKFMQEIKPVVPGSRGGYGFAQWTGSRRRDFEAWAAARGLELSSYAANYGFLKHELTNTYEKRVIPKLRAARTVEEATRIFSETFLRPGIPHMASRIDRAGRYA